MENPNTWTDLEHGIQAILDKYTKEHARGMVGLSMARTLADYVREYMRGTQEVSPVLEEQLQALDRVKEAHRKVFGS